MLRWSAVRRNLMTRNWQELRPNPIPNPTLAPTLTLILTLTWQLAVLERGEKKSYDEELARVTPEAEAMAASGQLPQAVEVRYLRGPLYYCQVFVVL